MTDRLRLNPDPLNPTDVDRAYAAGFEDGWDSTKPSPLLAIVLAALTGVILGALITGLAVHAAPRSAQATGRFDVSAAASPELSGAPQPAIPAGATRPHGEQPPSGNLAAVAPPTGIASWYDDGPGLYGAVPGWHWGDARYQLRVCLRHSSRCVTVTVRDFCGCPGGRVIDLSPAAFRRLAPLSRGLIFVTVRPARPAGPGEPAATPPATDVGP